MNGAVSAVLYERKITNAIKDISSRKQLDGQGQWEIEMDPIKCLSACLIFNEKLYSAVIFSLFFTTKSIPDVWDFPILFVLIECPVLLICLNFEVKLVMSNGNEVMIRFFNCGPLEAVLTDTNHWNK